MATVHAAGNVSRTSRKFLPQYQQVLETRTQAMQGLGKKQSRRDESTRPRDDTTPKDASSTCSVTLYGSSMAGSQVSPVTPTKGDVTTAAHV